MLPIIGGGCISYPGTVPVGSLSPAPYHFGESATVISERSRYVTLVITSIVGRVGGVRINRGWCQVKLWWGRREAERLCVTYPLGHVLALESWKASAYSRNLPGVFNVGVSNSYKSLYTRIGIVRSVEKIKPLLIIF